jgi:hypothetical protein
MGKANINIHPVSDIRLHFTKHDNNYYNAPNPKTHIRLRF